MIRYQLMCIAIILFATCAEPCVVHPTVECLVEKKLEILENLSPPCAIGGQVFISLFFFDNITDLETHAAYGDVSVYQNKQDLRSDIRQYTDWYEKNKCVLNPDSIMALELKIIESTSRWSKIEEEYLQHIENCKKTLN